MAKIKSFIISALLGVGGLAAVNAAAGITGAALGWGNVTVGVGIVMGLPGTVLLLVLRLLTA